MFPFSLLVDILLPLVCVLVDRRMQFRNTLYHEMMTISNRNAVNVL